VIKIQMPPRRRRPVDFALPAAEVVDAVTSFLPAVFPARLKLVIDADS